MSPGGTDVSLLQLVVGFFVAITVIAVITMVLRRRDGSRDLLGAQVSEMQARAAASPQADTRSWDAATRVAEARAHEAAAPADVTPDAVSRPVRDATAAPDGWSTEPGGVSAEPGGTNDAMVDAFAWLQIAALVEAGQRDQAITLLSSTMNISADDAEMLVDGLNDVGGGKPRP